ncbi:MAG: hypothetical protein P1P78_15770 [Methyloprofundus sp.]|nr:hypothetical protein [Methyloprofundus sp.]
MFKFIALAILLISSNVCLSDSVNSYAGIWQDTSNERNYYTLQEKDKQVVLINLSAIESSANTLKSAYVGNAADFVMSRISPAADILNKLKLEFQSPTEGRIYPICDACSVVEVKIRKIF